MILLEHLLTVVLVLAVLAVAAGLGGRSLNAFGVMPAGMSALEAVLLWTAVGFGILGTAIALIGLALTVHPIAQLGLFGAAAVAGRRELAQLPSLMRGAVSGIRVNTDVVSLSVFLVIALLVVTRALAPATDWDALMYHLRVPQQFLEAGRIRPPGDNAQFGYVGLPHMLYLPLLALGRPEGPALMSALFTLGLGLATFAVSLRVLDRRTAGLSLAVLWGSTVLLLVAATPRIDTILAFYLVLAQYALLLGMETKDHRFLYLGAALGGMAVGVKLNALVYLFALAPLAWVALRGLENRRRVTTVTIGLVLAGALPWLLKNGLLLGDPLYPFLGGRKVDPWLAALYAGRLLPPGLEPGTFDTVWGVPKHFNLVDFFTAPERITVEQEGASYHPNYLLLALPLWFVFIKQRVLGWLAGPAVAYVLVVAVVLPTTSIRYLIPAIPPLTVVALYCYGRMWDKVLAPRRARLILAATALAVVAPSAALFYRQATRGRALAHFFGLVSDQAYLKRAVGDYADAVDYVNRRLPPTSRVLMLFDARGFYFRVPVVQDNVVSNWALLSAGGATTDCLRSLGFTHVLVNRGALDYYRRHGFDVTPLGLDSFEGFARDCLTSVYQGGGFTVYEVHGPPRASPRPRTPPRAAR